MMHLTVNTQLDRIHPQEEYNKSSWNEIIGRCEEVGVDAFEINFSCPHGMPERKVRGNCIKAEGELHGIEDRDQPGTALKP